MFNNKQEDSHDDTDNTDNMASEESMDPERDNRFSSRDPEEEFSEEENERRETKPW